MSFDHWIVEQIDHYETEIEMLHQKLSDIKTDILSRKNDRLLYEETEESDYTMKLEEIQRKYPICSLTEHCKGDPVILPPVNEIRDKGAIIEFNITPEFSAPGRIELHLPQGAPVNTLFFNLRTNIPDKKIKVLKFVLNSTGFRSTGDLLPAYRKLFAITDDSILPIQQFCAGITQEQYYSPKHVFIEYSSELTIEEKENIWFKIESILIPNLHKYKIGPVARVLETHFIEHELPEELSEQHLDLWGRVMGLVLSQPHRSWRPKQGILLKFNKDVLYVPESKIQRLDENVFFVSFLNGINFNKIDRAKIFPAFGSLSALRRNYIRYNKSGFAGELFCN